MDFNLVVVVLAILALVAMANGHIALAGKIVDLLKGLFDRLFGGRGDDSDGDRGGDD